ncbi:hypothetical protein D320_09584 [Haloferax sp. BAB-2207]|nr:hypothetical protein D320_09584 [Haloferax sp. BAB-2207]
MSLAEFADEPLEQLGVAGGRGHARAKHELRSVTGPPDRPLVVADAFVAGERVFAVDQTRRDLNGRRRVAVVERRASFGRSRT